MSEIFRQQAAEIMASFSCTPRQVPSVAVQSQVPMLESCDMRSAPPNFDQTSGLVFWFAAFAASVVLAAWSYAGFAELFAPESTFPKPPEAKVFVSPALDPPPTPINFGSTSRVVGFAGKHRIFLINQSLIFAIDRTGAVVWKHRAKELGTEYFLDSERVAVVADKLYVPIPEGGFLVLDFDGRVLLRRELAKDNFGNAPALVDVTSKGLVLLTAAYEGKSDARGDTLLAVDNQGNIKWKYALPGGTSQYLASSSHHLFYFAGQGTADDSSKYPMLRVFSDEGERWHTRIEFPWSSAVIPGDFGLLYIRGTHSVRAFREETGRLLWTAVFPPLPEAIQCEKIGYDHRILYATVGSDLNAQPRWSLYLIDPKNGSVNNVPLPPTRESGCMAAFGIRPATGGFYLPGPYLTKIDKQGRLIWSFAPDLSNNRFYVHVEALAEGPDGTVFAQEFQDLYFLNKRGQKRWVFTGHLGSPQLHLQIDGLLFVERSSGDGTFALGYHQDPRKQTGAHYDSD